MDPLNGPVDPLQKDLPDQIFCRNPMERYAVRLVIP